MSPLVITASCGYTRPPRPGEPADTVADIARAAIEAARAGAAIVQVRVPLRLDPDSGRPLTELAAWRELIGRIREAGDVLIHAGVAAMPVDRRIELLEELRPDFASFLLGHHDIMVRGHELNSLRPLGDAVRLAQGHAAAGVRPEFELFGSGTRWKLDRVLEQVALPRPLAVTLFLGWDGGEWCPPTAEELLHRLTLLPADCVWSITVTGAERMALYALAIARGGNVRVGIGDDAWYSEGVYAESTAQLVARIVRLAGAMERPVATPAQAAARYGIAR